MLDMMMFRENANILRADHDKRKISQENIDEVIRLDNAWKQASYDSDLLRKSRNEAARGIANAKKSGDSESVKQIMEEVSSIGARIEELTKISDINKCLSENDVYHKMKITDKTTFNLLQGNYKGITGSEYLSLYFGKKEFSDIKLFIKAFKSLFKSMEYLFLGLTKLYSHNICHHDICYRNVIFVNNKFIYEL